jgi:DNA-directed RNA polymerase subunit F
MQPPALPANLPGSDELREQFTLLRRFLELPPERLARIRESIERIEKMPPERRQAMLERLPPATRPTTTITIPANLRADLDALLGTLSQDERDAIMERAESYDSAGQAAYFDGLLQAARLFSNPE